MAENLISFIGLGALATYIIIKSNSDSEMSEDEQYILYNDTPIEAERFIYSVRNRQLRNKLISYLNSGKITKEKFLDNLRYMNSEEFKNLSLEKKLNYVGDVAGESQLSTIPNDLQKQPVKESTNIESQESVIEENRKKEGTLAEMPQQKEIIQSSYIGEETMKEKYGTLTRPQRELIATGKKTQNYVLINEPETVRDGSNPFMYGRSIRV